MGPRKAASRHKVEQLASLPVAAAQVGWLDEAETSALLSLALNECGQSCPESTP